MFLPPLISLNSRLILTSPSRSSASSEESLFGISLALTPRPRCLRLSNHRFISYHFVCIQSLTDGKLPITYWLPVAFCVTINHFVSFRIICLFRTFAYFVHLLIFKVCNVLNWESQFKASKTFRTTSILLPHSLEGSAPAFQVLLEVGGVAWNRRKEFFLKSTLFSHWKPSIRTRTRNLKCPIGKASVVGSMIDFHSIRLIETLNCKVSIGTLNLSISIWDRSVILLLVSKPAIAHWLLDRLLASTEIFFLIQIRLHFLIMF